MATKPEKSTLPNVLSFKRLAVLSDALMFADMGGAGERRIDVIRQGLRGTQNVNDVSKVREIANVQITDSAKLPDGAEALLVRFDIRLISLAGGITGLSSSNGAAAGAKYRAKYDGFVQRAQDSVGLTEVCRRFARNILNGRWLWRNRTIAQNIQVTVTSAEIGLCVTADALALPLNNFNTYTAAEIELGAALAQGLCDESRAMLRVEARVVIGMAGPVEVYPSQVYSEKKAKGLARQLYYVGRGERYRTADAMETEAFRQLGQAALRDQKVLNAIRTIDTWYVEFDEHGLPIPVEPQGANLDANKAFRMGSSSSFEIAKNLDTLDPDSADGMFMIACLIRGGVYSGNEKPEKVKTKDAADAVAETE